MTNVSLIERSHNSHDLWSTVSTIAPPDLQQFVRWCDRFTDESIEKAILRMARKFSPDTPPAAVHRYVTGLLLNLEKESLAAHYSFDTHEPLNHLTT